MAQRKPLSPFTLDTGHIGHFGNYMVAPVFVHVSYLTGQF